MNEWTLSYECRNTVILHFVRDVENELLKEP